MMYSFSVSLSGSSPVVFIIWCGSILGCGIIVDVDTGMTEADSIVQPLVPDPNWCVARIMCFVPMSKTDGTSNPEVYFTNCCCLLLSFIILIQSTDFGIAGVA